MFQKGAAANATPETFVDLRKQVYDNGDHGLLGLALDPKFDEGHPYIYALYAFNHILGKPLSEVPRWQPSSKEYEGDPCAEENRCVVSGRLVRLTAEGNHAASTAAEPVEDVLIEDWCQQSSTHSIGDLQFGPEGALFVSGGEGAIFTASDYGQFELGDFRLGLLRRLRVSDRIRQRPLLRRRGSRVHLRHVRRG